MLNNRWEQQLSRDESVSLVLGIREARPSQLPTNKRKGTKTSPPYTLRKQAAVISLTATYCYNHEMDTTVNVTGRQTEILKYTHTDSQELPDF